MPEHRDFWAGVVYGYGILGTAMMVRDHFGLKWGCTALAAGLLYAVYYTR